MSIVFLILTGVCMLAVLASLGVGVVAMARGGSFNARYSNKLMQARVVCQGLAIVFLVLALNT
ncbi:MAG: twin transmembrane helix small protein [Rhodospirillaceae bacterium]|nr:twin transmembrane helix small protein [Rhodospirillaceae bacterium]